MVKASHAFGYGFANATFSIHNGLFKFTMNINGIDKRRLGNRLALYYMGPKHTGELWVYISTPLPNPSGNTGVF